MTRQAYAKAYNELLKIGQTIGVNIRPIFRYSGELPHQYQTQLYAIAITLERMLDHEEAERQQESHQAAQVREEGEEV